MKKALFMLWIWRVLLPLTLVLAIVSGFFTDGALVRDPVGRIKEYAKTHEEFTLKEAIASRWLVWDVAYKDVQNYGKADDIKAAYGLTFEIAMLDSDEYDRLLFFRDGRLIEAVQYEWFYLEFPEDVVEIRPDMVFVAQWQGDVLKLLTKK